MANLNVRIDSDLKHDAEVICSDLGISLSAATTMFLKQLVRCNGIPFQLKADPFYSAENQAILLASKKQLEEHGGTEHDIIES